MILYLFGADFILSNNIVDSVWARIAAQTRLSQWLDRPHSTGHCERRAAHADLPKVRSPCWIWANFAKIKLVPHELLAPRKSGPSAQVPVGWLIGHKNNTSYTRHN